MVVVLHTLNNSSDYSSHDLRRSYRGAASYLKSREGSRRLEPCEQSTCDSASKSRLQVRHNATTSRCRTRTPSPPHSSTDGVRKSSIILSPSSSVSKAPRSVLPDGNAAISARAALRGSNSSRTTTQLQPHVRWASTLVTSVQTRPRTLRKDVPSLFYSRSDEKRFRKEAETAVPEDDEPANYRQLDEDSLGSLSDDDSCDGDEGSTHKPLWQSRDQRKDYAIYKAVVKYHGSSKTYGYGGGLLPPVNCALEVASLESNTVSFSFDDAAFWNGQLTWS